ncbi:MAG: protein kinase [Gemmatimonadota bacterium]|nr:MAG: protein kinase [Gemmatimonadota bacterium]
MGTHHRAPQPPISPEIDAPSLFDRAQDTFSGDFEVRRLVAASHERALFVVRDTILRREVALRVHLQPNTRSRRWFHRETELLASLHHRGLRTIFSAGFKGEWAYRVAKWVEGESLEAAVQRAPRPIPSVLRISRTLTSLLEYVHSNQIIVRRILPTTVMLETTGRTVVIDLRYANWCIDVADPWDEESEPFVAPEIRDGSIGDPRSDLYTAGAIIYNALTARIPDIDPGLIVPPSEIRPASPRIFDRLLMRTLDRDPANRYHSAEELSDDLLSELGEAGVQIPVSPLRSSATEDTTAFEKHLRRALGDDYELLGELGSGGFGRVYQVRDLELEREVALKVLHPFLTSDPTVVERFRREAQLAARVVHPYIVNTYDIGGRLGLLWYTMELVPGGNLGQVVNRDGPLPLDRVLKILLECLEALKHAHSYGLVHRDLKPENILIHETGSVRIADFGLAMALQRPDWQGGASSRSGTPEFAAPEQMLGEHVDLRADLYSLTLCTYFSITGASPFGGGTAASILARHTTGSLPDLKHARNDLSEEFIRVMQKGAARDPADRFQSAGDFEQAVIESQRRGWVEPLRRWMKNRRHRPA